MSRQRAASYPSSADRADASPWVSDGSYYVDFTALAANEDPISRGGLWANSVSGSGPLGVVTPNKDMQIRLSANGTTRICCEKGATNDYDDSLAAIPGFPGNQRVVATFYKQAGYNPNGATPAVNHEMQIHVGVSIFGDGNKRSVEVGFNDQGGYFMAGFNGGLTSWGFPNDSIWYGTGSGSWPVDGDVFTVELNRAAKTLKAWQNLTLVCDLQWNTTAVVNATSQAWLNDLGPGVALAALRRIGAAAQEGAMGWRDFRVSGTLLGAP